MQQILLEYMHDIFRTPEILLVLLRVNNNKKDYWYCSQVCKLWNSIIESNNLLATYKHEYLRDIYVKYSALRTLGDCSVLRYSA